MRKYETWIWFVISVILILFYATTSEAGKYSTVIVGVAPQGTIYASAESLYTDDDLSVIIR